MDIMEALTWIDTNQECVKKLYNVLGTMDLMQIANTIVSAGASTCDKAFSMLVGNKLDLRHLVWSLNPTDTVGTHGTFLKAFNDNKFYKLSAGSGSSGIYGHESINECIASDFLTALGIHHTQYQGSLADICLDGKDMEAYVCWSDNFCGAGDSKIRLETQYEIYRTADEDIVSYLQRVGLWSAVEYYIIVDFLIINRDRHGANIEILKHPNGVCELAPMYDHGFSLVSPLQNDIERVEHFDSMADVLVNNFTGSHSLYSDLNLLTAPIKVNSITEDTVTKIVSKYATFISTTHTLKIIEILWSRYKYLEERRLICH